MISSTTYASEELTSLAGEVANRPRASFNGQTQLLGKTAEDSDGPADPQTLTLNCPPNQCSWGGLDVLMRQDPELGLQRWTEIKQAASNELESGHRVATANEGTASATLWQRAQFLAMRDSLAGEWKPQNGIEWALVDMMSQAYAAQLFWQERMMCNSCLEADTEQIKKGQFQHPRVSDAQAIDQAAGMVDRFNRTIMRSLRALRDLRRHSPTLVVHRATQVNVAENQINLD